MALHFRQIEVWAHTPRQLLFRVVEEEQAEVEQRTRHGLATDRCVLLHQVPSARTHQQHRRLFVELVLLAVRILELDLPPYGIAQVRLPVHRIAPGGRIRILEVGHEHGRAGVQRVDDHLAVHRSRNFDAAVQECRWNGRNGPSRKSGSRPACSSAHRAARACSNSRRRASKLAQSAETNSTASGVKIARYGSLSEDSICIAMIGQYT